MGLVAANAASSGRTGPRESGRPLSSDGLCVVLKKIVAGRNEGLTERLGRWSPEQHEEFARLLGRLANELLREEPEPVVAGTGGSSCGGGG